MKRWRRSSEEWASTPREVLSFAESVARSLRSRGLRVSTAELVELARILTIYSELRAEPLTKDDAIFVTCSILCKRPEDKERIISVLEDLLGSREHDAERDIVKGIYTDLEKIGATPGSRIRIKNKAMNNESVQAAFARLRVLGIIKNRGSFSYVVPEKHIRSIARKLSKHAKSYREAISRAVSETRNDSALSLAAKLGSELPRYLDLNKLGVSELTKLYRYTRSRALRKFITRTILERTKLLSNLSNRDARALLDILVKEKMLTSDLIGKIVLSNPKLVERVKKSISKEELLDIALKASSAESNSRIDIAASALGIPPSRKKAVKAILSNDILLSMAQKGELSDDELSLLSSIVEAREMIIQSLINSSSREAYRDYAVAELGKAEAKIESVTTNDNVREEIRKLLEKTKREVSMILSGNTYAALKSIVRDLSPLEAIKLLNELASKTDPLLRAQALRLLYIVTRKYIGSLKGGRRATLTLGKGYGRVSTRYTVFNIIRLKSEPVAVIRYKRLKTLLLLVDKSASMRDYAVAAVLSAAALAALVKRLVLFDENIYIFDKINRLNVNKVLELIFSTSFSGYTNIVAALKAATQGIKADKLVLVSDLKQTVRPYTDEDVCSYLGMLREKGWSIAILTPRESYPSCVKDVGARVSVINDVNKIRKVLLRI